MSGMPDPAGRRPRRADGPRTPGRPGRRSAVACVAPVLGEASARPGPRPKSTPSGNRLHAVPAFKYRQLTQFCRVLFGPLRAQCRQPLRGVFNRGEMTDQAVAQAFSKGHGKSNPFRLAHLLVPAVRRARLPPPAASAGGGQAETRPGGPGTSSRTGELFLPAFASGGLPPGESVSGKASSRWFPRRPATRSRRA